MSKQMMIYENIQPLSADKHKNYSVNLESYSFLSSVISVPILASEFLLAAREYPIIFSPTGTEGEYIPLAVMGLKEGQNLLFDAANNFIGQYVPGFIRRYPFVLGSSQNSETMTVCIDEGSKALVADGSKGVRLFEANGEQSAYLKDIIAFLEDYQQQSDVTRFFCKHLHELKLLEPMTASITFNNIEGADINLTGFYVIRRETLKTLSDESVIALFKRDGLEVIYAHLQSLSNINRLSSLLSEKLSAK